MASLEQFREGRWRNVPRAPQRELTFPQWKRPAGLKACTHSALPGPSRSRARLPRPELIYLCLCVSHTPANELSQSITELDFTLETPSGAQTPTFMKIQYSSWWCWFLSRTLHVSVHSICNVICMLYTASFPNEHALNQLCGLIGLLCSRPAATHT